MIKALAFSLFLFIGHSICGQSYAPYILGTTIADQLEDARKAVETGVELAGLEIAGQYRPAEDNDRWIIVFTSSELKNAVRKTGGLTGFAAALRIGITREGSQTKISYTNPVYWGMAYFRDDYEKVADEFGALSAKLKNVMSQIGPFDGTPFGSEKGIEADKLKKYRYMMGMAQFDDTIEFGKFSSHAEAVKKIDGSIRAGKPDISLVYKVEIPDQEIILYGFALSGEKGEGKFLPVIDISEPRHTAFLPYEVLVTGNEVHMLHGRFRIALSFPDLTMGTFTKIMSTPPTIKKMLEQLVE